ncbi:hypothetical protein DDB_G0288653 [Dictyostelium discoideum AX4]|uniref:Uncharacterized protein n=1 Tax=Dictyostelium discoideum TaxID=44689 RepID=Q54IM5_DICDI|nr:hypothetical protein DDB_G0288653 [Dictyostelium discoideum AX4]EAL63130.1 hypothetical protein DDB_G0288653 [Dictyostelium discoideum AX4]|eukprot:XP_636633.1 hypothetical protein DDB_G0288653 [Dictyostelium discoideum AX4]
MKIINLYLKIIPILIMLQVFKNFVECISDQSSNISLIIQTSPNHTLLLLTTSTTTDNDNNNKNNNNNNNNNKIFDNILQSNNIKSIIDHSTLSSYIRNNNAKEKIINSNDFSNSNTITENSNSCANIKISIQQTLFLLLTLLITICSFFI